MSFDVVFSQKQPPTTRNYAYPQMRRGFRYLLPSESTLQLIYERTKNYAYTFPDLLTFNDAPTPIEQQLFVMYLEHLMRAFQGTFHANPDYALWYGWNEMQHDLVEIRAAAEDIRRFHKMGMK